MEPTLERPTYSRYTAGPLRAPRRPRWLQVLKLSVLALVVCACFTAGVLSAWLQRTAAQVARNDPAEVKAASKQLTVAQPSQPVDILIIGSDRRVGQPDLGARSDTLMVVRLDPETGSISMLSVPRDLQVDIPGYGLNKINAAYSYGGAKLTVQTVKQVLGIPINDFIDLNFDGFRKVVDRLGGAYMMVDRRYYNDTAVTGWSSIDLEPGYQLLDGAQALEFVRFRHDQNGDFTRVVRQQMFLREMKRQLTRSASLTSFPRLLAVAAIMSHYAVSDISSLSRIAGLLSLALRLHSNRVYQTHIDGSTPMIGGVSYVVATQQQVQTAVQQFLHPVAPPTGSGSAATSSVAQLPAASVRITVLNGSGATGEAATVAGELRGAGFTATVGGNAAGFGHTTTTVTARPAAASVARRLASLLAPAQVTVEGASSAAAAGRVTVVIGSSFAGRLGATSATTGQTSQTSTLEHTTYDLTQWRTLQAHTSIALFVPSVWSSGLGYDQFRSYRLKVDGHSVAAAVAVGTTPQGGYWDIQALEWSDPPILSSPDATRRVGGRTYRLSYDGAHLHLVAWSVGNVTYWVANTLDDELPNATMLALASSTRAVRG